MRHVRLSSHLDLLELFRVPLRIISNWFVYFKTYPVDPRVPFVYSLFVVLVPLVS